MGGLSVRGKRSYLTFATGVSVHSLYRGAISWASPFRKVHNELEQGAALSDWARSASWALGHARHSAPGFVAAWVDGVFQL